MNSIVAIPVFDEEFFFFFSPLILWQSLEKASQKHHIHLKRF
jgi:hypothetical protein